MQAKKSLGQNFLIDDFYINSIVNAINVFSNDLIIEIGPGRGALTRKLKEKESNLIAYEIDNDMRKILDKYSDSKTKIVYQDFLKSNFDEIKSTYKNIYIIGNLPYYITTPILEHIIKNKINPKEMIIMVQKEVANRFLASPCSKEYGYFTLFLKYYFDIEKVIDVPPSAFNPIPKVESTVLKFKNRNQKPEINEEKYFDFLKDCFKQKRKTLKNNLSNYDFDKINIILQKNNISPTVRAEEIPENIFIEIAKSLE